MTKSALFWRKGIWALLSVFFLFSVCAVLLYLYLESQLPNVDSLKTVHLQVPLRIYTQDGLLIQEYGEKKRIPVAYQDIPPMLINALLATEDQRFFEHSGVDLLGLGRATLRMMQTGSKSQGGSTITMQVARNFFLSRKKTFLRKFNEILLAVKIDRELSKEKILELYLNKIYLGNRAYGVGAAAEVYFGKPLKELSLAELALLAGLPQAPSTQNPVANSLAAKNRRDHVLARLLEGHYINDNQYREAIRQPITAKYHGTNIEISAPYVAEMIRQSLYDHFGDKAYTKGYKVYTTIQSSLQKAANQSVENNLIAYDHRHGYRGAIGHLHANEQNLSLDSLHKLLSRYPVINDLEPALIVNVNESSAEAITRSGLHITLPWEGLSWARPALRNGWMGKAPTKAQQVVAHGDIVYVQNNGQQWQLTQVPQVEAALIALNPNNGALEALVGGFSFQKSKFNRATQSERQPGSSFKPFIYAAALNKGYTWATLVNDAPVVVDDASAGLWRPHNHNMTFNGPTRLKEALVLSRNLVSIRVLDDLGFDYAINFLTHFGFRKEHLPKALSLALGSLSVTPLDLTSAYAIFANGGFKIDPYLVDHITDNKGTILLQAKPSIVCPNHCEEKQIDSALIAPRVLPKDIAFLMNSALLDVIQHGTASAAKILNRKDIAGKTGTTNDQVDAWFAGFNSNLVTTAWVGFDNPRSLHEYAASAALPLWIDFMKTALAHTVEQTQSQPDNVVALPIDPITGQAAKNNQSDAIIEYFRAQDLPNPDQDNAHLNTNTPSTTSELSATEAPVSEQENSF